MHYVVKALTYENRPGSPTYIGVFEQRTRMPDIPVNAFLVHLRDTQGAAETTLKNHASTLATLLNSVAVSTTVQGDWRKLKREHLAAYHAARAQLVTASSLKTEVSRLRSFFEWCYQSGWLDQRFTYDWNLPYDLARNIKLDDAKQKSNDPFNLFGQYIPEADFKYALQFNPRKSSYERTRDEIILKLGYYSGLRCSEVVDPHNFSLLRVKAAMKRAEEDGMEGFLLTIIGKGKAGGKARVIYVVPALARQMKSFMRNELARQTPDAHLLLGKRIGIHTESLCAKHASNLFGEMKAKLLVEGDLEQARSWRENEKNRHFHSLRHSYATNFANQINANVQPIDLLMQRMGHANRKTTEIYLWFAAKKAGDYLTSNKYVSSLDLVEANIEIEEDNELF